ncbi:MAG: AI-2E family transporter [Bacteroidales bacterium]|nr:AI-2E family transporter [Bacteroidales bacterium]
MKHEKFEIPLFARATIFLVGIIALLAILYIAKGIIVPIVFSIIIAILLHPVVKFFVKKKINRIVAIVLSLLITFIVIAAFGALVISQASRFADSWPVLVERFTAMINEVISGASEYFNINPQRVHDWILKTQRELLSNSGEAIGKTLVTMGGVVVVLFLVPVYIFLILFYQPLILDFIRKVFGEGNQSQVNAIVSQTKTVIQRYLLGLVIETVIIAILETATLLILGIEYAILLGIIGALLNLIPYIGGIVAVALPMIVALVTKETAWYALYVLAIYYFIQLVDNNYIVPKIVASKVKINALFSIIAILVGNAMWGIPGMFLSIPLLAIIKLVCDHIEPLKPLGFLLGDTMPPLLKIKPNLLILLKGKSP